MSEKLEGRTKGRKDRQPKRRFLTIILTFSGWSNISHDRRGPYQPKRDVAHIRPTLRTFSNLPCVRSDTLANVTNGALRSYWVQYMYEFAFLNLKYVRTTSHICIQSVTRSQAIRGKRSANAFVAISAYAYIQGRPSQGQVAQLWCSCAGSCPQAPHVPRDATVSQQTFPTIGIRHMCQQTVLFNKQWCRIKVSNMQWPIICQSLDTFILCVRVCAWVNVRKEGSEIVKWRHSEVTWREEHTILTLSFPSCWNCTSSGSPTPTATWASGCLVSRTNTTWWWDICVCVCVCVRVRACAHAHVHACSCACGKGREQNSEMGGILEGGTHCSHSQFPLWLEL